MHVWAGHAGVRSTQQRVRTAALPSPPPLPMLQVHLRLQWRTEAVRGQSTKVEVDMAGLSLVVMGGLQVGGCGAPVRVPQALVAALRQGHWRHAASATSGCV